MYMVATIVTADATAEHCCQSSQSALKIWTTWKIDYAANAVLTLSLSREMKPVPRSRY